MLLSDTVLNRTRKRVGPIYWHQTMKAVLSIVLLTKNGPAVVKRNAFLSSRPFSVQTPTSNAASVRLYVVS